MNIRVEAITFDTAVKHFKTDLQKKLKSAMMDDVTIKRFTNAVEQAVNFCKERFTGEFGRFGGQFTSHGPDHAGRVLALAQKLVTRMPAPRITVNEFFFLGMAAILHDVGMVAPLPEEVFKICKDEDQRWQERRKRHGEATAEVITRCQDPELKAIAKAYEDHYYTFLPHICAAHCTSGFRKHVQEIRKLTRQHFIAERYATLAGILLFADELDITWVRASPDRRRYHEFRSNLTKAHWWKHWLVSDAEIDGGILRISCLNNAGIPHVEEFAQWTKGKLEQQLQMLRTTLDDNGNDPLWRLDVTLIPLREIWWQERLPELTTEVLEEAQKKPFLYTRTTNWKNYQS